MTIPQNPGAALTLILEALKAREITAFRSSPPPESRMVALGMRATAAQRFIEALVPAPLDRNDDLTRHMVGQAAELTVDEDPWTWEGGLMVNDDRYSPFGASALELRFTISIPYADLPEVMRRLGIGNQ